jgi:beta-aspartyl-peptidase (threonine type)
MLSKPPASHPGIPSNRRGFGLTLLTTTRNPARAARALYLNPQLAPHAFLSGLTAESLAESLGEERVDPSYYFTEARWREHRRGLGLPEEPLPNPGSGDEPTENLDQLPTGTVGAVALDARGCISAVTSTGGRTNKLVGRIGDTPHMGSGFWAEQWSMRGFWRRVASKMKGRSIKRSVGVSGTGDGDVSTFHMCSNLHLNC